MIIVIGTIWYRLGVGNRICNILHNTNCKTIILAHCRYYIHTSRLSVVKTGIRTYIQLYACSSVFRYDFDVSLFLLLLFSHLFIYLFLTSLLFRRRKSKKNNNKKSERNGTNETKIRWRRQCCRSLRSFLRRYSV